MEICPELARFVKTLSVPLTASQKKCAKWQEGARKAVERAFGIAQSNFQILCRPMELWCESDIEDIVRTCFIPHNMMVEVRLQREEQEKLDWCEPLSEDEAAGVEDKGSNDDDEFVGRHQVDLTMNVLLQ